jgi:hypothetical protein
MGQLRLFYLLAGFLLISHQYTALKHIEQGFEHRTK